jgi:hypothetical protein
LLDRIVRMGGLAIAVAALGCSGQTTQSIPTGYVGDGGSGGGSSSGAGADAGAGSSSGSGSSSGAGSGSGSGSSSGADAGSSSGADAGSSGGVLDGGSGTAKVGDKCTLSSDCASGDCTGLHYCTEVCASSAGCGSNTAGTPNACLGTTGGVEECFPTCATQTQCQAFAATDVCDPFTTVENAVVGICSAGGGTGKVGDRCTTNAACASGDCTGLHFCSEVCASSADCGSNTAGTPNACLAATSVVEECFPTCATQSQCQAFAATDVCDPFGTVESPEVGICRSGVGTGKAGDQCALNSDCASGKCAVGLLGQGPWCTEVCTSSAGCGSSSAGTPNACLPDADGLDVCFPTCSTQAQCQALSPTATCDPGATVENTTLGVCFLGSGDGKIGDKCASNADCTSGECAGSWCTEVCTSSAGCGSNTARTPNECVLSADGLDLCFPGCSTQAQCQALSLTATCVPGTTVENTTMGLCVVGTGTGKIGDKCTSNGDCASDDCAASSGQGLWCTEVCTSSAGCGSNSAGVMNECVLSGDGLDLCFPGCSTQAQCQAFAPSAACDPATTIENTPGATACFVSN